jgi:ribosomal protein S21
MRSCERTGRDGGMIPARLPAEAPSPAPGEKRLEDRGRVTLAPGEDVSAALKRLGRQLDRAGVLGELRRREHACSRGQARRTKRRRALLRSVRAAKRRAARGSEE